MKLLAACRSLMVFSIVTNILLLVAPLHMLQVYDRVLASRSSETLLYITLIAGFALVIYGLCESIRGKLAQRISANYAVNLADPLFNGMTNGAIAGDKASKVMRDFDTLRQFVASRSMVGLFDLPFAPIFLVMMFLLHIQLGLLTAFGVGLLVAIAWLNKVTTAKAQEKATRASSEAAGFAGAITSRSEDIQAMGLLPSLVERWGGILAESLNAQDKAAGRGAFFYGVTKSARQILQIAIMAWGAWLVLQGELSGGVIFAASMISGRALQPIEQVIGGWDTIGRARTAYKEIDKAIQSSRQEADRIAQPTPQGRLIVRNVCFHAGEGEEAVSLLKNVSFSADPGQITALIGPSGAGKSTLARVIAGALRASSGEVLLDGCEQQNWPMEQWGRTIGYVGQDIRLFPGSVAANIARMDTTPNEQAIVGAARIAGAHDLINSFPNGYQTVLGQNGFQLSGGQKQRIALARALYTSPKLLVLDEPNAHLDQEGELLLMKVLQAIKGKGVNILTVTQRQQLLQIADQILLVKNGHLIPFQSGQAGRTNQTAATPVGPAASSAQQPGIQQPQPAGSTQFQNGNGSGNSDQMISAQINKMRQAVNSARAVTPPQQTGSMEPGAKAS